MELVNDPPKINNKYMDGTPRSYAAIDGSNIMYTVYVYDKYDKKFLPRHRYEIKYNDINKQIDSLKSKGYTEVVNEI